MAVDAKGNAYLTNKTNGTGKFLQPVVMTKEFIEYTKKIFSKNFKDKTFTVMIKR